jgi:lipopolysaccharide export system protein LptA
MNRAWQIILAALLIAFIGWLFYWAMFSPKPDLSQLIYTSMMEQAKQADLTFKKVSFEEVSNGEKFWQLQAATAMVNKNTGLATLQNTTGTFYKKGKPVLRFRSPAALWEMKKQEIYLDKPLGYDAAYERQAAALARDLKANPLSLFTLPAEYRHGLGYWFQAKNLSWKVADQLLICTGGIRLNKGNVSGQAATLKGDVEFNQVILEGQPLFTISPAGTAPVTIEARSFAIASAQDLLSAYGDPVITWQDARVTANSADYLQAKKLLRLSGDVRVRYKDIEASGSAADYLVEEQKVILTGAARAAQAGSNLSSDRIIVSLQEQKIALAGRSRVVVTEEELKP